LFIITSPIEMKTGIWLEIAWINTFRIKYWSQSIQIRHSFLVFCLTKDYCESTNAWWNRIWTVIIVVFCRQDLFLFFKLRMRHKWEKRKKRQFASDCYKNWSTSVSECVHVFRLPSIASQNLLTNEEVEVVVFACLIPK